MLSTNSRKFGLNLLYDAAHTHGVDNNGESVHIFGDLSARRFKAAKVLSTIEGDAIESHSCDVKQKISI